MSDTHSQAKYSHYDPLPRGLNDAEDIDLNKTIHSHRRSTHSALEALLSGDDAIYD